MNPVAIPLKGGRTTRDPRLDRIPSEDPRRFAYTWQPAGTPTLPAAKKAWGFPTMDVLDQGREGACVGFAFAHDVAITPAKHVPVTDAWAQAVYKRAQRVDEWPGEQYAGTSVNAGAKVLRDLGLIREYRWVFTVEEVATVIATAGPVVVGTDWYEGMYRPGADLLLKPSGPVVGGHAYLLRGYAPENAEWILPDGRRTMFPFPTFRMRNSWSERFGVNGDAFMSLDTLRFLLSRGGDACVPVGRRVLSPLPTVPA